MFSFGTISSSSSSSGFNSVTCTSNAANNSSPVGFSFSTTTTPTMSFFDPSIVSSSSSSYGAILNPSSSANTSGFPFVSSSSFGLTNSVPHLSGSTTTRSTLSASHELFPSASYASTLSLPSSTTIVSLASKLAAASLGNSNQMINAKDDDPMDVDPVQSSTPPAPTLFGPLPSRQEFSLGASSPGGGGSCRRIVKVNRNRSRNRNKDVAGLNRNRRSSSFNNEARSKRACEYRHGQYHTRFKRTPVSPVVPVDLETLATVVAHRIGTMSRQERIPRREDDEEQRALTRFLHMDPPHFRGDVDPREAKEWLTTVEEAFETIKCGDDRKVRFGTYLLRGPAKEWWQSTKDTFHKPISWRKFKRVFETRYFPQAYRDQRVEQFMYLRQGEMTVEEYAAKFAELERYAPEMVSNGYLRAKKFESGLRTVIADHVVPQRHVIFQDVLETALAVECRLNRPHYQQNTDGQKRDVPSSSQGGKYQGEVQKKQNQESVHVGNQIVLKCDACGKKHATEECWKTIGACLKCGSLEHRIHDCPLIRSDQSIEVGPSSFQQARRNDQ